MKNKSKFPIPSPFARLLTAEKLIATFGRARLVRRADGRHWLLGGTASDQTAAREWCSLFAPEVVFACLPAGVAILAFAE